jgi:hypothetical protein
VRALGQPWELLRAEYYKLGRLHFEAPVKGRIGGGSSYDRGFALLVRRLGICILLVLSLFIEIEAQAVPALMADRQVRENEVSRQAGTVEIGHARHGHTRQDGDLRHRGLHAAVGDRPGDLEGGKEEEVGVVVEGHIVAVAVWAIALKDAQLDHWWRIDWSPVCGGCRYLC